ncbi:siderophore ABC transporter substrate-binding protein [Salirhabdus sp. Marseille-P4669]|uniref:siderophore ABC transporter substrate-binding protein n=1 Tax=Salirhabdus sp. Marseille-P4669 TaxID=2042310 RepID=UPI000C7E441A|nr:siderophore ABC transporter substrate-binding protein [Salirhabdus sp. Marseille-P4669]
MKKYRFLMIIGLVLTLFLAACGSDDSEEGSQASGEGITIKHELGTTTVEKNPETVVVFDYGALDTLDKLGVEVAGVSKDSLPAYLSKYDSEDYVNIGSLKEPDFETIHGMDPDVILISGRQSELYEDLSDIAPTVYVGLDTTRYMESFEENLTILGELFDKEAEVKEEFKAIQDNIAALNEKATNMEEKALIVLTTGGKISAYGSNSRFGIVHDVFGVKTADENIEASTHGMKVSYEYILETNPDYLFVIDRDAVVGDGAAAEEVMETELVKQTNAYKSDKIVYLDPDTWYLSGGGLVSVQQMIDDISAVIE